MTQNRPVNFISIAGHLTAQSSLQHSDAGKLAASSSLRSNRWVSTGKSASASSAPLPRAKSSFPRWPSFMALARTPPVITARRFTTRCATPPAPTARPCSPPPRASACWSFTSSPRNACPLPPSCAAKPDSWKWPLFQIAYMTGLAYVARSLFIKSSRHFVHVKFTIYDLRWTCRVCQAGSKS